MKRWFVTGTDTDVGKTVASAWLCRHLQADYWKPVQSGARDASDTATVATLSGARTHPPRWLLDEPLSPHLAAERRGVSISLDDFVVPTAQRLVIEGAGGVLVPLNERDRMVDLMLRLACPVIVVARSALGTINHTCLTLEALRARGIAVAGVILNGEPNAENRAAIERFGEVCVLAELPVLAPLTPASLGEIESENLIRLRIFADFRR